MGITARELFDLARQVELRIAKLYEDLAMRFDTDTAPARFFASMGAQEHIHAAWVDAMMAEVAPDFVFTEIESAEFATILGSVEDIHDEVLNNPIDLPDALEIIIHLENSAAEDFYLRFPKGIPGLPDELVARMVKSCIDHARNVADFRTECIEAGRGGVYAPRE